MHDLSGKIALVTGGNKGIGRAIALALAEAGASVAITGRVQADLDSVAGEIKSAGGKGLALSCDVTDAAQVERLPAQIGDALGPVDILVNNAGMAGSHKFIGHPDDLWFKMLDVNLTGTYRVCKAIVPGMVERKWGRIINIASVASKSASRYTAAYTASKHGLLGLTRALALELVGDNITVNAICPGYVDTPMTDGAVANIVARTGRSEQEARQFLSGLSPQNRLIDPEEVAALAVLLASESARGINGQAINIDGGMVMF